MMHSLLTGQRWDHRAVMAWRPRRAAVLPLILGACALSGWGAYIGKSAETRGLTEQMRVARSERDGLEARIQRAEQVNAELLTTTEGKLGALREELRQTFSAREAVKAQLAAAQKELGVSKKRLEQAARDRITETGSIKAAEPLKKPSSKS
ncbi:hypothetical protein [Methylobacterium gregans]|uniref:Uncharacterized protein n=1 Tax=Methylobacterium gregans TaxID=374424 RepID=A0AA37HQH8_9HYPH|nr:hypothetical protein [Methylobacterium gregans]MDQ0518906.1 zinc resistance-associated protein [Methylobacterium gregans]GJD79102.1 hypothetical protein NBEOAGPD_2323 [Methylobacterium gregans]GLS56529.1 hypothetical protein GCM10007886_47140 [Methylobacterium gregans]